MCLGVDRRGPRWIRSLMEKHTFKRMNLSDVRVIMMIMRVLVKDVLCQALMRWIPVLELPLSGVRGRLWLRHVMPGIKWRCFLRTRLHLRLPGTRKPPGVTIRGPECVLSRVTRRSYRRQVGGRMDQYGSGPDLVFFRLVVPLL
jgi:hypothetical protein